ncbi:MAG: SRPBCC family protein [Actinobacteria bacterium]|nr:SRPBCC family protein [Actinomycetota bacterium]
MNVVNVHERDFPANAALGSLVDELASGAEDRLWPWEQWPAMRFDRPLQEGAVGGHGPIRYDVEEYEHGQRVRFRFTRPGGFFGFHEYRVLPMRDRRTLQHVLRMRTTGWAQLTWPLIFEPMHNALIEDSLSTRQNLPSWVPSGSGPAGRCASAYSDGHSAKDDFPAR